MATTKIWPVKGWLNSAVVYIENPAKTTSAATASSPGSDAGAKALEDVIGYAMDSSKTEQPESVDSYRCFVTGINCTPTGARDQMLATKQRFGKDGGIVAFHAYQSFKPGETTPEQAHEIGVLLARALWGSRFEVLVATHLDRGHLHNHLLVNSVSFMDGKRFRSNKTTYRELRETSDALCRRYGLSVIEHPSNDHTRSRGEWRAEQEGRSIWRTIIRDDLEQALDTAISGKGLMDNLRRMGYGTKWNKELSVRSPGKDRFVRVARQLGNEYSTENLCRRFDDNFALKRRPRQQYRPDPKHQVMVKMLKRLKAGSLFWLYYHYRYQIFLRSRAPKTQQLSSFMREECRKLDDITRQMKLLWRNEIDSLPQLEQYRESLAAKASDLERQRKALYNKAAKAKDPTAIQEARNEIAVINDQLKFLRRQLRDCTEIKKRSLSDKLVSKKLKKGLGRKEEVRVR